MIIPIRTWNGEYDIVLENGALAHAAEWLKLDRKTLVLTDDGVPAGYAERIAAASAEPYVLRLPAGEATKCISMWEKVLETMLNAGFTRGDCLVAVGGGVIGDLGGFAAACYMRGIDFYNVPTTLLSQVDSSVGGKTAVDFRNTKNTVGSFYPPKRVLIDPETLKTLEPRQWSAGMAEVIKMAATFDADLFAMLETENVKECFFDVIRRALEIKKDVVEKDPKESGLRKALNFGHTIGHAIESRENGRLLHGECVALGMIPLSNGPARERIRKTLEKYDLPTRYEKAGKELISWLTHDKKAEKDGITTVVVDEIGSFRFEVKTAEALADVAEALK